MALESASRQARERGPAQAEAASPRHKRICPKAAATAGRKARRGTEKGYEVRANAPCTIALPGLPEVKLGVAELAKGAVLIPAEK